MILFDLIPGERPSEPVALFHAIHYTGGPAPDFLPQWAATDRLTIQLDWNGETPSAVEPRKALGMIDGFFYRHSQRTTRRLVRKWGSSPRTSVTARICFDSPGEWRQVKALYALFTKPCPWCLKNYGAPEWAIEEVRLDGAS